MDAIRTENLTKTYGKFRGITQLNLEVPQGAFFGFIGPNGAGKSTTIRTLLGLIRPTFGEAEVLGFSVTKDRESILRWTGYLPSEAVFYPGMRVREVLKLSGDLRRRDCAKEAKLLCERLRLDENRKVEELSFGNRKKLGIVCALQHDPELLILDEPTSGLDPLMQREFFEILKERNQQGTTVFLSTHVLSEVQRSCTRAAILREGRIIACDSVENLSRTNARRVALRGRFDEKGLPGIRDLNRREDSVSFLYSGELHPLLSRLAEGKVEDLTISEPDLEEVFLHYYAEGGEHP